MTNLEKKKKPFDYLGEGKRTPKSHPLKYNPKDLSGKPLDYSSHPESLQLYARLGQQQCQKLGSKDTQSHTDQSGSQMETSSEEDYANKVISMDTLKLQEVKKKYDTKKGDKTLTPDIKSLYIERSDRVGEVLYYNLLKKGLLNIANKHDLEKIKKDAIKAWKDLNAAMTAPVTQSDRELLHKLFPYDHNTVLQEHDLQLSHSPDKKGFNAIKKFYENFSIKDAQKSKSEYNRNQSKIRRSQENISLSKKREKSMESIMIYYKWRNGVIEVLREKDPLEAAAEALRSWKDLQSAASTPFSQLDRNQLHKFFPYDHNTALEEHDIQLRMLFDNNQEIRTLNDFYDNFDITEAKKIKTSYDIGAANPGINEIICAIYCIRSEDVKNIIVYYKWKKGEIEALHGEDPLEAAVSALQSWKKLQSVAAEPCSELDKKSLSLLIKE